MIKKYSNHAFTLIELLVVISIIGIITAISIVGLTGAREGSRDARRKSDLELIRSGLELYKADCNTYPTTLDVTSGNGSLVGNGTLSCLAENTYITKIPADPLSTKGYVYLKMTDEYIICASLEQGGTDIWCGAPCGGDVCNYVVTNP